MPELQALYPLGGRSPLGESLPGVEMAEVAGRSLVSIAARRGREDALRDAVRESFGADLPGPGRMAAGPSVVFVWMAPGQWFADADEEDVPDAEAALAAALGATASLTEQSDAWVRLHLTGPGVRPALQRLCMLDLDDAAFPPGRTARTVIEHLGAVVLRPSPARWEMWSARSSARSFAHALRAAAAASRVRSQG